jgi:hypothetical protein
LLGLLAFAGGCGDSDPVAAVGPETGKATGEAQQKAREAQYGPGGVLKGRPNAPPNVPQNAPQNAPQKSPGSK